MRIFCDTASLAEIEEWAAHPWVSGFTTNPTLMRSGRFKTVDSAAAPTGKDVVLLDAMTWARDAVEAAAGKPISIDGPPAVAELGLNVWRKVLHPCTSPRRNHTAVCHLGQLWDRTTYGERDIISVFAGRIMDTGRDPYEVIHYAKRTGAQVLWASVREPYNIVQAEEARCDIVTVPPAILRKYLDWHGKPLEVVAEETIAQFDRDREGLW